MSEKQKLVPRLRFPEFGDKGEWKQKKIGAALIELPRPIDMDDEGEYSLVTVKRRYGGVVSRGFYKGKLIKVKTQFLVQENDFLISKRQIVHCACGVVPKALDGSIVSNEYSVLRAREGFDVSFFEYFAQQAGVSQSFLRCSIGIVIEKMLFKLNEWLKQEFLFPSLPEQQKIADCLASLDELITLEAQKLDTLRTHKKGLMQQLFPAEGETQPRLRFPEFQNAGDWEEYSLGQLIEIASGQVDPKQPPYCDLPQIGSENIESHSGKLVNVKTSGEKGVISGNYAFDEGDILYSKIRPALNKVAAPSFKGICSADIYPVRPADGNLLRGYLFYLLLSQDFLDHAIRNSERGKIPKINRDALDCFKALIPSPAEQQRIATCLSSLDALITAEAQKHEALKTHKKGLMQQLFPALDEAAA